MGAGDPLGAAGGRQLGTVSFLATYETDRYTTEQALRRLRILGYTAEDESIRRALSYLESCLRHERALPDPREKRHDWDLFCDLMLAANIRLFRQDCAPANAVAERWGRVITAAFASGAYCAEHYCAAYRQEFGQPPRGGRLVDFVSFYALALLPGILDRETERRMVAYILQRPDGVYYLYNSAVNTPPTFCSLEASRWLSVIELLARYRESRDLLAFAADWIEENRLPDGRWDMGKTAKDGTYLPLSDDWRRAETRIADCTERIGKLLPLLR